MSFRPVNIPIGRPQDGINHWDPLWNGMVTVRREVRPTSSKEPPNKVRVSIPSEEYEANDSLTSDVSTQCSICLENRSKCVMVPCKHLCMCVKCTRLNFKDNSNPHCPLCKVSVNDIITIFQ